MRRNNIQSNSGLFQAEQQLLQALCDHPFLSRRQLELYLHTPARTLRHQLQELKTRGWVQRHNARQPWMHARSLLSLTIQGIEAMAQQAGLRPDELVRRAGLESGRIERLLVMTERVFQVRTFLLWLQQESPQWDWSVSHWDVEIGKLFSIKDKAFQVPFHGAAVLERRPGQVPRPSLSSGERDRRGAQDRPWVTLVVEWDMRRVPVEQDRERLVRFVMAQNDSRFFGEQGENLFPVWAIIAQDEFRLQDYYAVMRGAALGRQLPMPRAYLTTFAEIQQLRSNPALPIWYSTVSGQRTPLLYDTPGSTAPWPTQAPWRKLAREARRGDKAVGASLAPHMTIAEPRHSHAGVTPELLQALAQGNKSVLPRDRVVDSSAAISLLLKPHEKRILDEVADHPLLTASEIALVLRLTNWLVRDALTNLAELNLVAGHRVSVRPSAETERAPAHSMVVTNEPVPAETEERFLLTDPGMRHLATTAGFENGLSRYAKARGWAGGLSVLLRNWEHTREENLVFLSLARSAQQRQHEVVWLSELESRLYYSESHDVRYQPRRRPRPRSRPRKTTTADQSQVQKRRRHSFLPDGRGTYVAEGERYEFALEIDRSSSSRVVFQRKLTEYYACLTSNILRGRGIELLRLLIVTHSWERAETLRELAVSLEAELEAAGILPVFITTFSRLRATTADAPIWLRVGLLETGETALTAPKSYCFDCFIPKPRPPRKPAPTIYSS